MSAPLAHPTHPRWLAHLTFVVLAAFSVGALAAALSSCKGKKKVDPPTYDPFCDCPEPSTTDPEITGDDGDDHRTFDLALEISYAPADGGTEIFEQEDILLSWEVAYDWEGCTVTPSTPGSSGVFTLTHTLMQDGEDLLLGHPDQTATLELRMDEKVDGSILFDGAEVSTSPGSSVLYWTARIEPAAHQECTYDEGLDLAENNVRAEQIYVKDCRCSGGFESKQAAPFDLEWDEDLSQLSWKTSYQVEPCGEEEPGETGTFSNRVRVYDASGSVLFEETVAGTSMTAGAAPDEYSLVIPVAVSSGGQLEVALRAFAEAGVTCPTPGMTYATLYVP